MEQLSGLNHSLFVALKRSLRSAGKSYRQVAEHLGISESALKRCFSLEQMSTERLCKICEMLNMSLSNLLSSLDQHKLRRLTPDQEYYLAQNLEAFILFYFLLQGWRLPDATSEIGLPQEKTRSIIRELEDMRLVERTQENSVRVLVDRDYRWSATGPLQELILRIAKEQFQKAPHENTEGIEFFITGELSQYTVSRIKIFLEDLERDFRKYSLIDLELDKTATKSVGLHVCFKRWRMDLSQN